MSDLWYESTRGDRKDKEERERKITKEVNCSSEIPGFFWQLRVLHVVI